MRQSATRHWTQSDPEPKTQNPNPTQTTLIKWVSLRRVEGILSGAGMQSGLQQILYTARNLQQGSGAEKHYEGSKVCNIFIYLTFSF